jgi:glycosyltransferase involved in cell wall biosynthesis
VEDRFEFYKGLDLYLNTSLHEGIPISILEAMSYGIPIIAPNVGGLEEILDDGIQGYLVEGREPKVFANRCLNIYNNKLLKHSMERSAREKVKEKFSNDRMAKEYYNLYLDVFYKTNKKSL